MNQSKWATLAVSWAATSLIVGVALAGGGLAWGKRAGHNAQQGWKLEPVLAATRDLSEGDVLGPADVAVRNVPEQLVTDSVVRPAAQESLVGKRLQVAMMKDDVMLSSHFEERPVPLQCATDAEAAAKSLGLDDPQVTAFLEELKRAVDAQQPKRAP